MGSYPTLSPITCTGEVPRSSAGLLSVALDVTDACAFRTSGCWPERSLLRVRTLLYAPDESWTQRRVGRPKPIQVYLTA